MIIYLVIGIVLSTWKEYRSKQRITFLRKFSLETLSIVLPCGCKGSNKTFCKLKVGYLFQLGNLGEKSLEISGPDSSR